MTTHSTARRGLGVLPLVSPTRGDYRQPLAQPPGPLALIIVVIGRRGSAPTLPVATDQPPTTVGTSRTGTRGRWTESQQSRGTEEGCGVGLLRMLRREAPGVPLPAPPRLLPATRCESHGSPPPLSRHPPTAVLPPHPPRRRRPHWVPPSRGWPHRHPHRRRSTRRRCRRRGRRTGEAAVGKTTATAPATAAAAAAATATATAAAAAAALRPIPGSRRKRLARRAATAVTPAPR